MTHQAIEREGWEFRLIPTNSHVAVTRVGASMPTDVIPPTERDGLSVTGSLDATAEAWLAKWGAPPSGAAAPDDHQISTPSAHTAYAYNPRQGDWSNGCHHAQLDQDLTTGRLRRKAGDALCKPLRQFWGLEPSPHVAVDCARCLDLAARHGVTLTSKE